MSEHVAAAVVGAEALRRATEAYHRASAAWVEADLRGVKGDPARTLLEKAEATRRLFEQAQANEAARLAAIAADACQLPAPERATKQARFDALVAELGPEGLGAEVAKLLPQMRAAYKAAATAVERLEGLFAKHRALRLEAQALAGELRIRPIEGDTDSWITRDYFYRPAVWASRLVAADLATLCAAGGLLRTVPAWLTPAPKAG